MGSISGSCSKGGFKKMSVKGRGVQGRNYCHVNGGRLAVARLPLCSNVRFGVEASVPSIGEIYCHISHIFTFKMWYLFIQLNSSCVVKSDGDCASNACLRLHFRLAQI